MAVKIKMRLTPQGLVPVSVMGAEDLAKLKYGQIYNIRVTKQRSRKAHNFYFEVIRRAAEHWPEGVAPEPKGDENLLRAWLQCKVGNPKRWPFELHQSKMAIDMLTYFESEDRYAFYEEMMIDGDPKIVVFAPESIAEDEMDELEFEPLRRKVFEFIEMVMGTTINDMMRESDKAA